MSYRWRDSKNEKAIRALVEEVAVKNARIIGDVVAIHVGIISQDGTVAVRRCLLPLGGLNCSPST